jgi:hypothetical protein
MNLEDPVCSACGERKSAHVATGKGPFTHPREARGEGTYVRHVGTIGGGVERDDYPFESWEFVPAKAEKA